MTLGLHKNCLQRLIERIAELLPQLKVQNRMFLDITRYPLPSFPTKLTDTYVVIDWPDAMRDVEFYLLNKTQYRLIERKGYNYLYQIVYKMRKRKISR